LLYVDAFINSCTASGTPMKHNVGDLGIKHLLSLLFHWTLQQNIAGILREPWNMSFVSHCGPDSVTYNRDHQVPYPYFPTEKCASPWRFNTVLAAFDLLYFC
jgi:hypothetical protein